MATVTDGGGTWNTTAGNKTVVLTPAADDLLVVIHGMSDWVSGDTSVVTDNNADGLGTYTKIGTVIADPQSVGGGTAGALWISVRNRLVGSATSTTVTVTNSGDTGGGLSVFRVSGMTRTGAAAVRQFKAESNQSENPTAIAFGLATLTTNPIIIGVLSEDNPATQTPPTGFTESDDTGWATPTTGLHSCFVSSGQTSSTYTYTAGGAVTDHNDIGVELDASAVAPFVQSDWPSPPPDRRGMYPFVISYSLDPVVIKPFNQNDWPLPTRQAPKPPDFTATRGLMLVDQFPPGAAATPLPPKRATSLSVDIDLPLSPALLSVRPVVQSDWPVPSSRPAAASVTFTSPNLLGLLAPTTPAPPFVQSEWDVPTSVAKTLPPTFAFTSNPAQIPVNPPFTQNEWDLPTTQARLVPPTYVFSNAALITPAGPAPMPFVQSSWPVPPPLRRSLRPFSITHHVGDDGVAPSEGPFPFSLSDWPIYRAWRRLPLIIPTNTLPVMTTAPSGPMPPRGRVFDVPPRRRLGVPPTDLFWYMQDNPVVPREHNWIVPTQRRPVLSLSWVPSNIAALASPAPVFPFGESDWPIPARPMQMSRLLHTWLDAHVLPVEAPPNVQPFSQTEWPVPSRRTASLKWLHTALQWSTLPLNAPPNVKPFHQDLWPNPRVPGVQHLLHTWIDARLQYILATPPTTVVTPLVGGPAFYPGQPPDFDQIEAEAGEATRMGLWKTWAWMTLATQMIQQARRETEKDVGLWGNRLWD